MKRKSFLILGALLFGFLFFEHWHTGSHETSLPKAPSGPEVVNPKFRDEGLIPLKIDRTALQNSASSHQNLQALIIDEKGTPIAGAEVLPWEGRRIFPKLVSDSTGTISFPHATCEALVIFAPGYYPAFFLCNFNDAVQSFQIGAGKSLSGSVFLTGELTNGLDSLPVHFDAVHIPFSLPPVLQASLQLSYHRIPLAPGGTFSFKGLPPDWSGDLHFPPEFSLCSYDGPGSISSNGTILNLPPVNGLAIHLMRSPGFSGNVISSNGGKAVRNAKILATVEFSNRNRPELFYSAMTKRDGSFFLPVPATNIAEIEAWCEGDSLPNPIRIELEISGSSTSSPSSFSRDLSAQPNPWFLGTLSLKDSVAKKILVMDEQRNPIFGAFAEGRVASKASGSDGVVQVVPQRGVNQVKVFAAGYSPQVIHLSVEGNGPTEVVLSKSTSLTFVLELPHEASANGMFLHLTGSKDLMEPPLQVGDLKRHQYLLNIPPISVGNGSDEITELKVRVSGNDRTIHLWGFNPNESISYQLFGSMGNPLSPKGAVILLPQEHRDVRVQCESEILRLHGLVLDMEGNPIENANVNIESEAGYSFTVSGRDGAFSFDGLPSGPLRLVADKRGYSRIFMPSVNPTTNDAPHIIRLGTPRTLDVFFIDQGGLPIQGGRVTYTEGLIDRTVGEAQRLTGVPTEEFELVWRAGGLNGKSRVPGSVKEFTVVLPAVGSVELAINLNPTPNVLNCYLVLKPTSSNEEIDMVKKHHFPIFPDESEKVFVLKSMVTGSFHAHLEYGISAPLEVFDLGLVEIKQGERLYLESNLP